jgi:hypothetical protein
MADQTCACVSIVTPQRHDGERGGRFSGMTAFLA